MAAAAPPLLEAAAHALARLIAAAAGALGGAAANEEVNKRVEEAEKSKDKPIAKAETKTATATACQKCPPDCGFVVGRNWNMSEDARLYQARISGFPPYSEWQYAGVDFDGFRSAACLLLEAKARYDQFFYPESGDPKVFFQLFGVQRILMQANRQSEVVWASPPATLHWHFQQPLSFTFFSEAFAETLLPIQTFLTR
nr:restriction endonuclease fold toxin 5 domain-containing protein [uncultured Caldimonas sp.]